jgi:hypothetical protein
MFAISVVASSLRRTEITARSAAISGPGRERQSHRNLSRIGRNAPRLTAKKVFYRVGNAKETEPVRSF